MSFASELCRKWLFVRHMRLREEQWSGSLGESARVYTLVVAQCAACGVWSRHVVRGDVEAIARAYMSWKRLRLRHVRFSVQDLLCVCAYVLRNSDSFAA